jgi:3-hydroxybutyryl-CoA dehydrogenase
MELGTECLGVHTGEHRGTEGSNVIGFARFRLGDAEPSELVELVVQPNTAPAALASARALFEGAGLHTAVCHDAPGRILDRLLRPFFNATLRRLDEGLASADDMDLTLKLGLGYPEGTIALLERTGLAPHAEISQTLHDALGDPGFLPARRAQVAKARTHR